MKIVFLCKRQYTNQDLIDDKYGRLWHLPLEIAKMGHQVHCLCLSYQRKKEDKFQLEFKNSGLISWQSINLGKMIIPGVLRFLHKSKRTVTKIEPDLIWASSDSIYCIIGHFFAKLCNKPLMLDLYDNYEAFGTIRFPFVRSLYSLSLRRARVVTCVSNALSRYIQKQYKQDKATITLTNAIDVSQFSPEDKQLARERLNLPEDIILIGTAGDLSAGRGANILFEWFLNQESAGLISLAVAGPRSYPSHIPVHPNIFDMGVLPHESVSEFLSALDIVVLFNTVSEFGKYCFPQKFYEVIRCKKPIVAANIGDVGNLLRDYPWLLYSPDDLAEFDNAMNYQIKHGFVVPLPVLSWQEVAMSLEKSVIDL